jgi:hypothetical protein
VQSGWLGFWAIVASCVLALVIARLTDYLAGHMKKTITVLLTISSIAFTILAMMCLSIIEPSLYCKKNNNRVYLNLIFCYCFFFFQYCTPLSLSVPVLTMQLRHYLWSWQLKWLFLLMRLL